MKNVEKLIHKISATNHIHSWLMHSSAILKLFSEKLISKEERMAGIDSAEYLIGEVNTWMIIDRPWDHLNCGDHDKSYSETKAALHKFEDIFEGAIGNTYDHFVHADLDEFGEVSDLIAGEMSEALQGELIILDGDDITIGVHCKIDRFKDFLKIFNDSLSNQWEEHMTC